MMTSRPVSGISEYEHIVLTDIGGFEYSSPDTVSVEAPLAPPLALGYLKARILSEHDDWHVTIVEPWEVMGLSKEGIARRLVQLNPTILGFSCYVWNITHTKEIIRLVKDALPNVKVVAGGPETCNPAHLTDGRGIDIGIVGEGEDTFLSLLKAWRDDTDIRVFSGVLLPANHDDRAVAMALGKSSSVNLTRLPSPYAPGIFDLSKYRHAYLETYRGCFYRCAYCYYPQQVTKIARFAVEQITKNFSELQSNGVKYLVVIDSAFNAGDWSVEVCQALAASNRDHQIELSADIRAEAVTDTFCESARRANFVEFQVGLQTMNEQTLRTIGRKFDQQKFVRGVKLLKDYGLSVNADLIFGLPGDSISDMWRAIEFLKGLDVRSVRVALLRVLPGTPLWRGEVNAEYEFDHSPPYFIRRTEALTEKNIEVFMKGQNHRVF